MRMAPLPQATMRPQPLLSRTSPGTVLAGRSLMGMRSTGEDFEVLLAVAADGGVVGVGAGPGVVGTDFAGDDVVRLLPVDEAVFAEEFRGVGGELFVLRFAEGGAVAQLADDFQKGFRRDGCERVLEVFGGFRAPEEDAAVGDDVARVEPFDDVHDGDARFGVSGVDGGLDAGGSRWRGRREACALMQPMQPRAMTSSVRICP